MAFQRKGIFIMKKKYIQLLFFIAAVIGIGVLIKFTNLHQYFSLTALQDENHFLKRMLHENYMSTVMAFIVIFAITIALAIPGSAALTLLGGYLFGVFEGGLYSLIGSVAGATISFLLFRYVLRDVVHAWYGAQAQVFKKQMNEHGVSYLLMLHFVTVVPFLVINALAAMSDLSLIRFMWTTAVGSLPIISVYSFAGKQLSYINSIGDIFSPTIIIAFVLLIALACMPIMIKKFRKDIGV